MADTPTDALLQDTAKQGSANTVYTYSLVNQQTGQLEQVGQTTVSNATDNAINAEAVDAPTPVGGSGFFANLFGGASNPLSTVTDDVENALKTATWIVGGLVVVGLLVGAAYLISQVRGLRAGGA